MTLACAGRLGKGPGHRGNFADVPAARGGDDGAPAGAERNSRVSGLRTATPRWVAFLGAALAAVRRPFAVAVRQHVSAGEMERPRARVGCGISTRERCWASCQFVFSERIGGKMLALGVPAWAPEVVMPVGFLLVTIRAIRGAGPMASYRLAAALFLLVPLALAFAPQPEGPLVLWIGIPVVLAGAVLGVPASLRLSGASALLLLVERGAAGSHRSGQRILADDLGSAALAAALLTPDVAGGGAAPANARLLRVYTALFGWLPGGLAITTAVGCAIFTWAGSGVTIVSMGGLLLPMLVRRLSAAAPSS